MTKNNKCYLYEISKSHFFTIPKRRLELNNLTCIGFFPIWLFGIGIDIVDPFNVESVNSSGGIEITWFIAKEEDVIAGNFRAISKIYNLYNISYLLHIVCSIFKPFFILI